MARGGELGFSERFALASDRTVPLAELIPGTEEYYFYFCLHYQNLQQFDRVEELLAKWVERHNVTARVQQIRNRQALLTADQNPRQSLDYLIATLGLRFDHQRETIDQAADLPTSLNASLISRDRLQAAALQRHRNRLNGFEDTALPWLAETQLTEEQRRELLQRLSRPDVAGLVALVAADLDGRGGVTFGSHPIHQQLLRTQLDQLLERRPSLLNETAFVNVYLSKLQPQADIDWRANLNTQRDYLDSLWRFISRLPDAHNSLKAHVLYHRLALDLRLGTFDKSRLLTYLKLPRNTGYVNPRYLQLPSNRNALANLGEDFSAVTRLPAVQNDEAVVRPYLQHYFVEATSYREYEELVRDDYLKELFAETKIVNGLGNPEQWYSLLPPAKYQALRERVDLDFAATNPASFSSSDDVALDVFVKNVPTLIVKVYRINALNYYQDQATQISTNLNLDGLIANHESTQQLDSSPFLRVSRRFTFPEIVEPGVYVVDLIGNGKSSRALIHKGQLTHVVRVGAAGHAFTVLDENRQVVSDAQIWLAGKFYSANEAGEIVIPFTSQPQEQPIVLLHGSLASLASFLHQTEEYNLSAGIHVEREALRSRRVAPVLIRPQLSIHGNPISLKALENVTLEITSIDHDGIASTSTVPNLELRDDVDLVHEFRVPPRLSSLEFRLKAQVTRLDNGQKLALQTSENFTVNQIDKTHAVECVHLVSNSEGYHLEVLGKTGEPRVRRPVQLQLKHRDFRDLIELVLRTDDDGRVTLGQLPQITSLTATLTDGAPAASWNLDTNHFSYHTVLHAAAGEPIEIPYVGEATKVASDAFSLLEVRGETLVEDFLECLSLDHQTLRVTDLPAGDYELRIKESGTAIRLRVTQGKVQNRYAIGSARALELGPEPALQIESVVIQDGKAIVQLEHVTSTTRVHVLANTFQPTLDAYDHLSRVVHRDPSWIPRRTLPTLYVQGRQLGDEFRYILERKYATKFPGNMLQRPELLLNPWDIRDTSTAREQLAEGDEFAAQAPTSPAPALASDKAEAEGRQLVGFENLDFLAAESFLELNLRPDADGRVVVELKDLGGQNRLYVVAVDLNHLQQKTVTLEPQERRHLDLRLARGLDPQRHFALQKQISVYEADQTLEIDNLGNGRYQLYDSLPRVYQLYETLLPESHLPEFRFVMKWPTLSEDEKRELYTKYACHELNFFISRKDPEFFAAVVRPYLSHKLHKTFLDHYLLEGDLSGYLSPWDYERLNAVERLLLARRIDGELSRTLTFLKNQWDQYPTDQENLNRLFDSGLLGQALAVPAAEERVLQEALELDAAVQFSPGRFAKPQLRAGVAAGRPAGQTASRGRAR